VDLSAHLVEQSLPVATFDCETQVDELKPRPDSPTWKEKHLKSGKDAESQVEYGSRARRRVGSRGGGDPLFDFDVAVAPLAARLSRDVLTQALEELQREYDLKALARRRGLVQGCLDADARDAASTVLSLKTIAGRGADKLGAARASHAASMSALSKVSACAMAGGAVRAALNAAKARMWFDGDFVNAQALHARNVILPSVYSKVAQRLGAEKIVAESIVDGAVLEALEKNKALAAAKEAALRKAEEGKQTFSIRVFVKLPRSKSDVDAEAHLPKGFTLPGEDFVDVMDEERMPSHLALPPREISEVRGESGSGTPPVDPPSLVEGVHTQPSPVASSISGADDDLVATGGTAADTAAETRPATALLVSYNVQYFRTVLLGPISIHRFDTVSEVEAGIALWLTATNSRHVRRINAMASGAALSLFLGGRRLDKDEVLLGDFGREKRSLVGLEIRPMSHDGESSVQWLDVREEPLPTRAELGLGKRKKFNPSGKEEEEEEGEEGGEGEEGAEEGEEVEEGEDEGEEGE